MRDVLTLHAIAIEDQGGDPTLRDRGLLESALAMPAQAIGGEFLHPDVPSMAAAYAFHLCRNHPFVDGNKRVAAAAMIAFLSDNGWTLEADADEAEEAFLRLASGDFDKDGFTDWARQHMREKTRMELRDFFAQLNYAQLAAHLDSGLRGRSEEAAQEERTKTMMEAMECVPAIREAVMGASDAESAGNAETAQVLRQQAILLTAIVRLAEDMGYEW